MEARLQEASSELYIMKYVNSSARSFPQFMSAVSFVVSI